MQKIISITTTLFLIILITSTVDSLCNPIPVPTLVMDKEYITISINCSKQDELIVNVTGIYPFKNIGHKEVVMYFPVPPEALENEIKVFFNNNEIHWEVSENKYNTIIGKYPMIRWKLSNIPKNFIIKVYYKYTVKRQRNIFRLLYAMATGRYLNGTYTKQCLAEVKFIVTNAPKKWTAKVSFVPPPTETFGVGYESEVEVPLALLNQIVIRRASKPFRGMDRDVLITIIPSEYITPEEKWVKYYPKDKEVEVTLNVTENVLKVLVRFTFRHGGFKVNVSEKSIKDFKVILGLSVLEWTGPSIQVITRIIVKEEYELKPGDYEFILKINEKTYYIQKISIGGSNSGESISIAPIQLIIITCASICAIAIIILVLLRQYKIK